MIRIFLTGDNHFGRKYERYPNLKEKLIESRMECFDRMVDCANENRCDIFAVAGDLFEKVTGISKRTVSRIVGCLGKFQGEVLVLPGNHDFYTGEEEVWKNFEKEAEAYDNLHLLKEFREYPFEIAGQNVVIYPALCQSKHSKENHLGWIREADFLEEDGYRIGMAHGALKGVTPDQKQEYFLMTEEELERIPMDVWLLGHTHVSYPELPMDTFVNGRRIYNAGTHEQTDLSCRTEGTCFLIELDHGADGKEKKIRAKKLLSGKVRFYDKELKLSEAGEDCGGLETKLQKLTNGCGLESLFRVRLSGTVSSEEYAGRKAIYGRVFGKFWDALIVDEGLCERITEKRIKEEFSEVSFLYQFLAELSSDGQELQMAYDLIRECRK